MKNTSKAAITAAIDTEGYSYSVVEESVSGPMGSGVPPAGVRVQMQNGNPITVETVIFVAQKRTSYVPASE